MGATAVTVALGEGTLGLEDGLTVQLEVPAGATVRDLRALIEELRAARALLLTAGPSPPDYSLAFGLVTTVGAYLGKRVVSLLVRRFQCASLIVLVLGGLITASVAAIGTAGALDLLEKLTDRPRFCRDRVREFIVTLRGLRESCGPGFERHL